MWNILLAYFIPVAILWYVISLLYRIFVRRMIHDSILFDIYESRDRLREMAINGEIDPDSFQYNFLESRLCVVAKLTEDVDMISFIKFVMSVDVKKPSPELERFMKESSGELKDIWKNAVNQFRRMILVNSPAITSALHLLSFIFDVVRYLKRKYSIPDQDNWMKFYDTEARIYA